MGRLKKYNTPEEKKAANLVASKAYYWRNKEARDQQSRINYKKRSGLLKNLQQNSGQGQDGG